jgi:hypothetical protein
MQAIARVAKAITGGISAASAAAVSAGLDGTITGGEWLTILVAAIGASYAVWQTPWLPGAVPPAE